MRDGDPLLPYSHNLLGSLASASGGCRTDWLSLTLQTFWTDSFIWLSAITFLLPIFWLHASVVHASGSGQFLANLHVTGPWISPGKPIRRAATTMRSNDLVVGEVHMLGPSFQRYYWHTGRCGSIAFGSSPRRGKTMI